MEKEALAIEIKAAFSTLTADLPRLQTLQDYLLGNQALPYMPDSAGAEYRLLAKRSVTNWMPMVVDATAQSLFVDNFRRHTDAAEHDELGEGDEVAVSPDWLHWQGSRMDAKQASLFRAALVYGHSFAVTEKHARTGKVRTRGVSPLRAVAMFEDPLADTEPTAGFEIVRWAKGDAETFDGKARYYTETHVYEVMFSQSMERLVVGEGVPHGAKHCPMTRFATHVDLDGNTTGLIEPLIELQDRVNQTVFDLLVAQTYTSFEVRTVSGMAPPLKMVRGEDGMMTPELDAEGNPIPDLLVVNAQRWMYSENPDAKFGHLPAGDLRGLIEAVELAMRQLSAVAQIPPHYMLGQIANVNAEGLRAAAESLSKKNMEIASSFGESIERIFRMFAEVSGETDLDEDDFGEVVWRDLSNASIAQTADALGKFAEMLDIPKRGLWSRVPGVTRTEMSMWARMREDDREVMDWTRDVPQDVWGMLADDPAESIVEVGAGAV